jgi:hypothetical protein
MHRRVRHRQGALTWVLLALGLLLLLHALFGSGGPDSGSWTVVSGQVVKVSTSSVTLRVSGTPSGTPPVRESVHLEPGTPLVLYQSGGPPVPRVLLDAGSWIRVRAQMVQGHLIARHIAVLGTVMTGQLQAWGPGRIDVAVPDAGSPITVTVTPATAFLFQTADPGLVRSRAPITAVVRATPDGGWTATYVRLGS